MKKFVGRVLALATLLLFCTVADAGAQSSAQGSLKVPVTGTAGQAGTFEGTIAVTKFETRGDQIVAVGFISGTLTQGSRSVGSALVGQVAVPVTIRARGLSTVSAPATAQPQVRRIAFSTSAPNPGTRLVQEAVCPVIDIVLGPYDVNILGVVVTIQPIAIQVVGEQGTPLGDLVCQISELIGNVAGLIGVINAILNLLILLLGGGLGGVIPGV